MKLGILLSTLLGLLNILNVAHAGAPYSIHGKLVEKGTGKPLAGFNIFYVADAPTTAPISEPSSSPSPDSSPSPSGSPIAMPAPPAPIHLKAVTQKDGTFTLDGAPEGEFKWVVNASGYERLSIADEQNDEIGDAPRKLYLEKSSYDVYETTVYDQASKRDDRTTVLTQKEFLTAAGANGDPIKAIQNTPGINRPSALSALVIIEGSDPLDTQYTIDTQLVPFVFHVGGLTTAISPEAVDRVELLPSGFGPEFGQSVAGYVGLYTRSPKTDRIQGFGFMDLLNAGALVEGPITPTSSFLISARQSYIGAVMSAALSGNSNFNLTTVPDFQDLTAVYENQLTPADKLRVVGIGSDDSLGFLLSQPVNADPNSRGNLNFSNAFFRIIPQWTHKFDSNTFFRLWLGAGHDYIGVDTSSLYFKYSIAVFSTRAEMEFQPNEIWKTYIGVDNYFTGSNLNFSIPVFAGNSGVSNPVSAQTTVQVLKSYNTEDLGLFWRNVVQPLNSPWTFMPGLRFDYYNMTNEYMIQPRAALRYAVDKSLSLRMAGGYYIQSPEDQQLDASYGNPTLKSEQAWHFTTGAMKDFRNGSSQGWTLSADFFYKYLTNLVISSSQVVNGQPLYFSNQGNGRAYGLRSWLKWDSAWFTSTIAYTLSRSTRWTPDIAEFVYPYDQTHNITLTGSATLGRNWSVSARLRYITGDPYTPITSGVFDGDNDNYLPIAGPAYSLRQSPFFQLDGRVDKKFIFNHWMLSVYLDIQNITNNGNPQSVAYSYNYAQTQVINGIPILPTLGFKGEF